MYLTALYTQVEIHSTYPTIHFMSQMDSSTSIDMSHVQYSCTTFLFHLLHYTFKKCILTISHMFLHKLTHLSVYVYFMLFPIQYRIIKLIFTNFVESHKIFTCFFSVLKFSMYLCSPNSYIIY